jgi:hypothetical protein
VTVAKVNGTTPGPGATAAAGQLPGTATNDSAAAGDVGEYVSSVIATGSATSFTTATAKNITSISPTAGDWDVQGECWINSSAASTAQYCNVTTSTGALGSNAADNQSFAGNLASQTGQAILA